LPAAVAIEVSPHRSPHQPVEIKTKGRNGATLSSKVLLSFCLPNFSLLNQVRGNPRGQARTEPGRTFFLRCGGELLHLGRKSGRGGRYVPSVFLRLFPRGKHVAAGSYSLHHPLRPSNPLALPDGPVSLLQQPSHSPHADELQDGVRIAIVTSHHGHPNGAPPGPAPRPSLVAAIGNHRPSNTTTQ